MSQLKVFTSVIQLVPFARLTLGELELVAVASVAVGKMMMMAAATMAVRQRLGPRPPLPPLPRAVLPLSVQW